MTTNDVAAGVSQTRLDENLTKIEELSKRLVSTLTQKQSVHHALNGPGGDLYYKASQAYMNEWMQNPAKIVENQVHLAPRRFD